MPTTGGAMFGAPIRTAIGQMNVVETHLKLPGPPPSDSRTRPAQRVIRDIVGILQDQRSRMLKQIENGAWVRFTMDPAITISLRINELVDSREVTREISENLRDIFGVVMRVDSLLPGKANWVSHHVNCECCDPI